MLILFLLASTAGTAAAQNSSPKSKITPFRFYADVTGMVPHPVKNLAFRRSFTGVYNISAGLSVEAFRGFTIGAVYANMLWKTPDNKIPGLNSYCQFNSGGIRVGYQMMGGSVTMYRFGFTAGEASLHYYGLSYQNVASDPVSNYKSFYMTPEAGICFFTEGNFAIGVTASWDFYDYQFDPYALYLNQHKAYQDSDLNGNLQHFNVGFSVIFGFKRKK